MTRRRRIKSKWHFTLGDFQLKKASYNSNGTKTFEVWHKGDLIGICNAVRSWRLKLNEVSSMEIYYEFDDKKNKQLVGKVFCTGNSKNGFPTNILKVEISPDRLNMVSERKILLEKWVKEETPTLEDAELQ